MRKSLSDGLRILSFVAAICVVMIHANTIFVVDNPAPWNVMAHNLFCSILPCWAVRYFFLCSGFLFGLSAYVKNGGYRYFVIKKGKCLLIPYLAWACVAAILTTPVVVMNNAMKGEMLLSRTVLGADSLPGMVDLLFGVTVSSPRALGVLWFVKHLMIVFALAPLWRLFARKSIGWVFILGWFFLPKYFRNVTGVDISQTSWFWLGMAIAVYLPRKCVFDSENADSIFGRLPKFVSRSFWLYCTHNILLAIILPAWHFVFGKSDWSIAMLTPIAICSAVIISMFLAEFIEKRYPRVWRVLNGGR